ncbi:delta-60 repeat domain-containing protein [Actinoplanes sp. M2I2]|uniref:delta-60 repeat domain-containing protein n=1 Tax=Actinoplanes sp. M2I2 TaxID=1734444 RepID=UPI002021B0BE|nr:delta-60 repeat domain-containing protein [Actinoplanes sp. M2I2]
MMVRSALTAVLAVGVLGVPSVAQAAARGPVLDPSFGSRGWVVNDYGAGDAVRDVALQPDGKIVAFGSGYEGRFLLQRHRADGSPDDTFGISGVVVTDVDPESWEDPISMVLQPGGRILVAGTVSRAGAAHPVLIRYLPDGSVDTSFGTDGRLFPALGAATSGARSADLAAQPDGRILLGLSATTGDGSAPPILLRLLPDGTPDVTFGAGGVARFDLGPREFDSVTSIAPAPDGGVVVAGQTGYWGSLPEPTYDVVVARFTSRGVLDTSFGPGGRVVRDFTGPGGIDDTAGLAVGRDGRILQTVRIQQGDTNRKGLLRYLPNGRPDPSLGRGGFTYVAGPVVSPVLRPDGRITTTGTIGGDVALARYRPDGTADPHFGRRGVLVTDLGAYDEGTVLKIQPDGRLLVGGSGGVEGGDAFTLVRYRP